jgi:hypothetical protein
VLGLDFLRNSHGNEKAPYVVTLFVAAFAWTAVHTSDRLANVPFVAYSVAAARAASAPETIDIRLRNVGATFTFDCFVLVVAPKSASALQLGSDGSALVAQLRGTVLAKPKVTAASPEEWDLTIGNMAPGADLTLKIPASGTGDAAVLVNACPNAAGSGDKGGDGEKDGKGKSRTPVLMAANAMTFFVEYEVVVLWSGLALWLAAMLWFARAAKSCAPPPPNLSHVEDRYDTQGSVD